MIQNTLLNLFCLFEGLEPYTDALNEVYETVSDSITRADLYAFAGVVASNFASTENAFDVSRFKVGRKDCSEDGVEDDPDENFPSSNMQNVKEVHKFFEDQFSFTLKESVAIMGAHSLGRMRTENSGYEGPWVPGQRGPEQLNNVYYREVVNVPWFLKVMPTNPNKHQWQRRPPTLGVGNSADGNNPAPDNVLLNTDAALAVNLNIDQDTGNFEAGTACVMCPTNRRPPPGGEPCCVPNVDGREICESYADSNDLFMKDFEDAFYKMIDNIDDDLTLPQSATTPTPPTETEVPTEAPTNPPMTPRPTNPPSTPRPTNPPRTPHPTNPPRTQRPTNPPKTPRPTKEPKSGRGQGGRGRGGIYLFSYLFHFVLHFSEKKC